MLIHLLTAALWAQPVLDPIQPQVEAQIYLASRVPMVPSFRSALEWDRYAADLRRRVLDEVVFRGKAREWRAAPPKVEWLETIEADGYRIRKLRYQILPGMMAPALLYEPAQPAAKAAALLNLNGHETTGVATPYIQTRCIHLAKNGVYALNPEWLGRGQWNREDLNHYLMPQIDLTGTSGLAVFYLAMERALDVLVEHPNVDKDRIGVTGLSGGGWQTTLISALDTRVKLSVPVAGHSSFVTRAQWPQFDLGDSEQTPSDLATLADYLHLTAMTAPRPLLLINNAKDSCCFRADYAPGPLMQAARSVYALSGALDKLRHFPNFEDGHNYGPTSRRALYEFLKTHFGAPINTVEGPTATRTAEELRVPMPADNATFQSLARDLSRNLPAKTSVTREQLIEVLRLPSLDGSFTVPVTTHGPANASETVLLIADEGRASQTSRIDELTAQGKRVIAVDPFYFGESKLASTAHLFAMQLAAIGERPLGLQVAQVIAAAKSANTPVRIEAHGRRTSFIALLAAAIETNAVNGVRLYNAMTSLKQLIDEGIRVDQQPEMFCFGLLEVADIPQIAQLVAPRPVETATAQGRKLLVISVDGLDHRYLRDADKLGLRIPNMRKLIAQGEWADGVLGVVPTVTWPSHTTLITGVRPDQHGILGNRRPRSEGGDYYWTADLLKTKTLWHATRAARKTSAAITWPVTVNADIDYNLPEAFARRNGGGMDLATIQAKATKGLVAEIAKADPTFRQEWMDDRTRAIATAYLLKNKRPDLLLLHFVDHDAAAHDHGPFTPEANKSMEYTDELIGQLIEAAGNDYVIALTADHGFERIDRIIATPIPASPGLLMATTEEQVNQIRKAKIGRQIPPHEFLRFVPNRKDVKAAFEPPPHTMFGPKEGPPHEKGNHGLWPARKDYRSVFVLYGPGIKARKTPEMSMLDIAPRLAAILGVTLPRN